MNKTREWASRSLKALAAAATLGLLVGSIAPATAGPNILVNGGFEAGDFTGWVQTGDTSFSGVQCGAGSSHSEGLCSAFFGPVSGPGGISQALSVIAGQTYVLSFSYLPDGGVPSSISASIGGVQVFSRTNPAASAAFLTAQFFFTPTTNTSSLAFSFFDAPGFLYLDAVSVALPEPGSMALLGLGLAGLGFIRRRRGG